jgi:hypothetical protein
MQARIGSLPRCAPAHVFSFSPSRAPASNLLAYAIHAIMEVNPEYQEELAAAKAELRQALEPDAQAAK